ncbi:MAG: hypothetical protein D6732_15540 [Methanobacteriota archaeon]|nr:MAG: hypothetical protein D6732_15540 [Euryarchaeota archaeon]
MPMEEFKKKLVEVFPSVGTTVTEAELKFRFGGIPDFEIKLQALVDQGILHRYEFGKSFHYKLKAPLIGASPNKQGNGEMDLNQKFKELVDIVKILAVKANAQDLLERLEDLQ